MSQYLSSKQILRLCSWRPPTAVHAAFEGQSWQCPSCLEPRPFHQMLVRLESEPARLLVQCPHCDHLAVIRPGELPVDGFTTEYAGPHVSEFTQYLDTTLHRP